MKINYRTFSVIILCVIFVYLSSIALINIVMDPFYIFRTSFFKVEPFINERYARIEFLKKMNGKFNSYIMGSSRMVSTRPDIIEKYIPTGKFYHFATGGATMYEHLLHLRYFMKNGYSVKNLYIGLDIDKCFTETVYEGTNYLFKLHPEVSNKNRIDFYWSYLNIFPKRYIKLKWQVNTDKEANPKYEIDRDGDLVLPPKAWNRRVPLEKLIKIENITIKKENLIENLRALRELVLLCRQGDINLILFITPFHKVLMDHFEERDYLLFLKDLSEIIPFWDFSGYNSITTDYKNYLDPSHYNPFVSRLIAARIFNDTTLTVPRDFGVWVTKKNIESHIQALKIGFEKNNRLRNRGKSLD